MVRNNAYVFLESIRIKPDAVAFSIVDDFTGNNLTNAKVNIDGRNDLRPVINNSGLFVFFKMLSGTYDFIVEADNFEKVKKTVTVSDNDVTVGSVTYADKIVPVKLIPLTSYPFPSGSTLFRGEVLDEDDTPVKEAGVELTLANNKKKNAITTADGEFVIYFSKLKGASIKEVKVDVDPTGPNKETVKKYYVKSSNNGTKFIPVFSKEGYVYVNNKMISVKEGAYEEIDDFELEIGKVVRVKKYLKKET